MTTDGITTEHWDQVGDLAAEVANASSMEDPVLTTGAVDRLLEFLEELENLYGKRPSILAVRADYIASAIERKTMLLEAYNLAKAIGDSENMRMIEEDLKDEQSWPKL